MCLNIEVEFDSNNVKVSRISFCKVIDEMKIKTAILVQFGTKNECGEYHPPINISIKPLAIKDKFQDSLNQNNFNMFNST